MSNYTKVKTLERLNNMTVAEFAGEIGCNPTTVYKYMNGELGPQSRYRRKIDHLLGIDTDEEVKPSVKELTGFTAIELAEIAGVSKASVHNWRNRKIQIEKIRQPIDDKIEAVIVSENQC